MSHRGPPDIRRAPFLARTPEGALRGSREDPVVNVCEVCGEWTCPRAELPPNREGASTLRRFAHSEPPAGARFDHCAEDHDGEDSACVGCAGWGYECWAWWVEPAE